MKISILGAGRWASNIAFCMDKLNYDVLMWERNEEKENPLFLTRKNKYVTLSGNVNFTHDLECAVKHSNIIIISILSQALDNLMSNVKKIKGYENKHYIVAMKGVEASTGRRLSEILLDNGVKKDNIAVWVGPGHVQSIVAGQPTNMIISAYREQYAKRLTKVLTREKVIDVTYSNDIIGTEYGAAAKNVIGIAAGILEGSNMEQKKGPLMPASVKELGMFIDALGGDKDSASGLAFLGDFQATLFDHNSKNLTYGREIVKELSLDNDKIREYVIPCTVEGIKTSDALILKKNQFNARASEQQQLKMPICEAVNDIVNGRIPLEIAGKYISEKITEALEMK